MTIKNINSKKLSERQFKLQKLKLNVGIGACTVALIGIGIGGVASYVGPYVEAANYYATYNENSNQSEDQAGIETNTGELDSDQILKQEIALATRQKAHELGLDLDKPNLEGYIISDTLDSTYPVMDAEDNQYYLKHLPNGEPNDVGSVYTDCRNGNDFSEQLTVLYGHNRLDGSMFSKFLNYKSQEYYEGHQTMEFITQNAMYQLQPFAGGVFEANQVFNSVGDYNNQEDFLNDINGVRNASDFVSSVEINPDDKVAVMLTCVDAFDATTDNRYLLYCKVVPYDKDQILSSEPALVLK